MRSKFNGVYRVDLHWKHADDYVEKGKQAAVYFPATGSLYLSEGEDVRFSERHDSHVTNCIMMVTRDGFAKTVRVLKSGSACYFRDGNYVSLLVDAGTLLPAIKETVADVMRCLEELRSESPGLGSNPSMTYDFSGYVTKNKRVPLVWQRRHNSPENVLGHADIEERADGMYAYFAFNSTSAAGGDIHGHFGERQDLLHG